MNQIGNPLIEVREAIMEDVLELSQLMNELGYPTSYTAMKERMESIFQHTDYKTFVAVFNNEVVGMAGATQHYSFEKSGKYIRIVALVIYPSYRQKGIGKTLLHTVETWAKEIGSNNILLNCGNREERKAAHLFYKNNGYQIKSSGYFKSL